MDAIQAVESLGSGGYKAVGNLDDGARAYGKYQVMGYNIAGWTREHLDIPNSIEDWMADHEAQDIVIGARFTSLLDKYTPEQVARIHFAGSPNAPGHYKDTNGMTVSRYVDKVITHLNN